MHTQHKKEGAEWRANELQRRINNRRQSDQFAKNEEHDDDLDFYPSDGALVPRRLVPTTALPALIDAKHELYGIQNEVFESDARLLASIRSADKQFMMQNQLRLLHSDLRAVNSSVRLKMDRLEDLHSHVSRLSQSNNDKSEESAFARRHLELAESIRSTRLSLHHCALCDRVFLPAMLMEHERRCREVKSISLFGVRNKRAIGVEDRESSEQHSRHPRHQSRPVSFVSQPPRRFRVVQEAITHNSVCFEWDPPIFSGSEPIFDFEVTYSVHRASKAVSENKRDATCAIVTMRTSCWCNANPTAANTFVLTDLLADQEYRDISLRAVTRNGTSGPSNVVQVVRTAPPVAPSLPLFVSVGVVTAKTITLSWTPPMDDGGVPVADYEIAFVEAIMEETKLLDKNFLDVSEVVYKPRLVRTYSSSTAFTITNLLSGKEHKHFEVRAVNEAGIPGAFSDAIESIFTIAPGNEFKLLDELQAAVNARTRIIDSKFLSGFMQRYERHHYIDLVSRFIISTHPKYEAKVRAIVERSGDVDPSEESDEEESQQRPSVEKKKRFEELSEEELVMERRRQFHFRIAELEKERKRVEYNVQWCKDRRVELVALIRAAENRILEKQAELERARMFRGQQMDSDVLENGLQRFYTKDLIVALEDEIEIEQLYIADTKVESVKTENYLRADTKRLEMTLRRLEERRAALALFESDPSSASRSERDSIASSVGRFRDQALYRAFAAFVRHRDECRESKRKMRTALDRVATCKLRTAVSHWRQIARELSRQEASSGGGLFGLGSAGLMNASLERCEILTDTREMLARLRRTDSQLQTLVLPSDQQPVVPSEVSAVQGRKFDVFWLEADAKLDVQDYKGAYLLYQFIESNPTWVQSMDMRQQYRLQRDIGRALFHMRENDQALQRFNRASIFGSRVDGDSKCDEGTALVHIADVHAVLGSMRLSVENFERALLCFEAAENRPGQLQCYRGLERVYSKLEDHEMSSQCKQLGDDIEFALHHKLTEASEKLEQLQQQLVGIGAESCKEIELERVKANVPRLRRTRIKCKYKVKEEVKWKASLEKLLQEKKALLEQGELDLKRALASDSTQVDSTVINATSSRYEIEDFKRKLAKMMGGVKAAEEHITKEILNSTVRVRNAEDEVKEMESELFVETGALMRRMLSKEPIRCFRFNATNEALKSVIGTASHGVTTCVASAGLNGLLFDLLTGACLSQALGDPKKEHLGEPIGHQAPIVSMFYVGHRLYTGSMDATLGVWDVKEEMIGGFSCSLTKLLSDFDSAVVSVAADAQWLVCGCSDRDVFVFDTESLRILTRVIGAHDGSAMAISVQSFKGTFTTGGADHRVKVWEVSAAAMSSSKAAWRKVKLTHTLEAERQGDEFFNGHLHPVTCVQQIASEIVSGDTGGRLVIWNLDAVGRKMLRLCDVHKAAVTCLQFDAMKIVSGSMDHNICVTDFATGHLIQTLVGHQATVLDLQFDRKRLITMSVDGKLRLWYWQTRSGVSSDRKKYHILGAGETLKSLSLKYRTSIDRLLKWNNLPDSSKMYLGQKLVVDIDTNGAASDELQTLDMGGSVMFGKLAYENLDFLATGKAKSEDVENQWAAQRLAQLAKEYFPPLTDDDDEDDRKESEGGDSDEDSDDDSQMAVDSDGEDGHDDEEAGDDGESKET